MIYANSTFFYRSGNIPPGKYSTRREMAAIIHVKLKISWRKIFHKSKVFKTKHIQRACGMMPYIHNTIKPFSFLSRSTFPYVTFTILAFKGKRKKCSQTHNILFHLNLTWGQNSFVLIFFKYCPNYNREEWTFLFISKVRVYLTQPLPYL